VDQVGAIDVEDHETIGAGGGVSCCHGASMANGCHTVDPRPSEPGRTRQGRARHTSL
jgi:hypothetical protein